MNEGVEVGGEALMLHPGYGFSSSASDGLSACETHRLAARNIGSLPRNLYRCGVRRSLRVSAVTRRKVMGVAVVAKPNVADGTHRQQQDDQIRDVLNPSIFRPPGKSVGRTVSL